MLSIFIYFFLNLSDLKSWFGLQNMINNRREIKRLKTGQVLVLNCYLKSIWKAYQSWYRVLFAQSLTHSEFLEVTKVLPHVHVDECCICYRSSEPPHPNKILFFWGGSFYMVVTGMVPWVSWCIYFSFKLK